MNICLVSHTGGLGGAELAILETARGLSQEGHKVCIACPNEGPFLLKAREITNETTVIRFDHWTTYGRWGAVTKLRMARGYWLAARKLAAWFRKVEADAVVTNTSTFPSAAIAAKSAGLPHIWYLHEFVVEDHGLTWQFGQQKSYKLMDRLSASIIVNSLAVKEKAAQFVNPDKLHLVYCATVTQLKEKAHSHPNSPFRLAMAGSVSEGKNPLLVLQALHLLKEKGLAAQLTVVGHADERYKKQLDIYIQEKGLGDLVAFKGYTDSLQTEFDAADAYVLASRNEAFGRVLVEAGRAGLPCLAPDSGGAPEIVTDGQNGLIFASGQAQSLADAIQRLADDGSLYACLAGNAARMANARFGLEMHMKQFRQALEAAFTPV